VSDSRISLLEERIAWFEKHAVEQDRAMLRQSEEIKVLRNALMSLRERMASRDSPLDSNEKPPHY
jgi:SlyX protein